MGNDAAISVENLSKRYMLRHQSRHDTLRDALGAGVRGLWQRLRSGGDTGQERDEFWALREVSFTVARGEVLGIIGRNGAGKSTLLKLLSRIVEPTTGRITLRGRVASLLEVGTGFHPELTGRENIFLNGAILGMRREEIRRKFDEIVSFAEVERFLDTPVKRYSSGMYVRLAFAVAAHLEPEILIVDEVLAVGDARFQAKCLGKMREVARNGARTVLFVSHNLAAVRQLCGRALYLEDGRVVNVGSTSDVVSQYVESMRNVTAAPATSLEVLPGLVIHAVRVWCDGPGPDGTCTLRVNVHGTSRGAAPRYAFGLQLTTPDNVLVSRIYARHSGAFIDGRAGNWRARFSVPKINATLAGGDYLVSVLVNEPLSVARHIGSPTLCSIPPADPYRCGHPFSTDNGIVALPVEVDISPTAP